MIIFLLSVTKPDLGPTEKACLLLMFEAKISAKMIWYIVLVGLWHSKRADKSSFIFSNVKMLSPMIFYTAVESAE